MSGWSHLKARGQAEPPLLPSLRVDLGGAVDEASLRELVGCSSRAAFAHVRSRPPPARYGARADRLAGSCPELEPEAAPLAFGLTIRHGPTE